jgi:NAD(P)H-hydrate epimerase
VINQCNAKIISIDIPSGMFVDTCSLGNSIVEADYTITFQTNKLCFLFAENEKYIGEVIVNNIGLNDEFIEKIESPYYLSNDVNMQSIYKPRNVFSHKGSLGHALLIAGNVGKMGAAVIAAKACLRCGVGLSTVAIPSTERLILQASLPEVMYINRKESLELEKYASIGIGPGIGTAPQEVELLKNILIHSTKPIVIDADAINILSANKELIKCIPKNSIITPHAKEFDRLVGEAKNEWHRMDQAIQFSKENNCVLVLKGHHTMIIYDQEIWFNHTGNSGLAKGGSGDALTGIITALLAQGYTSADAAKFGVYLHGKAADLALENQSAESMLISDVIEKIGMVFKQLI